MWHITWHVMWGYKCRTCRIIWGYECKTCLGVTWENMDGANGQTGGKNRRNTFVLTAFISSGLFNVFHIFTAPTCTTTTITLEPCALNAEFQLFIPRFNKIFSLIPLKGGDREGANAEEIGGETEGDFTYNSNRIIWIGIYKERVNIQHHPFFTSTLIIVEQLMNLVLHDASMWTNHIIK